MNRDTGRAGITGRRRGCAQSSHVDLVLDALKPSPSRAARGAESMHRRPARVLQLILPARLAALLMLLAMGADLPVHAARIVVLQLSDTPRLAKTLSALQIHAGMPIDLVRLADTSDEAWEAALAKGERPVSSSHSVRCKRFPRATVFGITGGALSCRTGCAARRHAVAALGSAGGHAGVVAAQTRSLREDRRARLRSGHQPAPRRGDRGRAGRCRLQDVDDTCRWPVRNPCGARSDRHARRRAARVTGLDGLYARIRTRHPAALVPQAATYIGPNEAWVRMGALYALDWDYDQVGATCAHLALREMQARDPPRRSRRRSRLACR